MDRFRFALFSAALSMGLSPAQEAVSQIQRAGDWRLELRVRREERPMAHAPRQHFEFLRWAPGSTDPLRLLEEITPGRPGAFLRDDGLCFLDPVQSPPRIVFADGTTLDYPLHKVGAPCDDWGFTDLSANSGGRVHFLGEDIVVVRTSNRFTQIARFRVDVANHTATDLLAILEVCGEGAEGQSIARAAMPVDLMLRVGDVLLWVNAGGGRKPAPGQEAPWRIRRLRGFDLAKGAAIDPDTLPDTFFRQHAEAILAFVEGQSHNRVAEFELWAVRRIGELGLANLTDRVIALLATANSAFADWRRDGDPHSSIAALRRVYVDALARLVDD